MKKHELSGNGSEMSFITLRGYPYQQKIRDASDQEVEIDCSATLDSLSQDARYAATLPEKIAQAEEHLEPLYTQGYYGLDSQLKHGEHLRFDEAFSAVAFVIAALNKPLHQQLHEQIPGLGDYGSHKLQAVAMLSCLSAKEACSHLTAQEIAGMVAATIHLDTVVRTAFPKAALSFGGMGGDKGYPLEAKGKATGARSKLFSLSTLSAFASAVLGPTHKHHSYPNTSKISGQSAAESYGVRSDFHSLAAFSKVFEEAQLMMSSCHNTRTLHTLSHVLRAETINHVIGPLAFTLDAQTPIQGFIGVNEKVHPKTIIEALQILSKQGYQSYENSAVYCGTNLQAVHPSLLSAEKYYATPQMKKHVLVDEIAPPPYISLVALMRKGVALGTFALHPEDFFPANELSQVRFQDLIIPNTEEDILHFNTEAISGRDPAKSRYLAMTIGLGIFVRQYLDAEDAVDLHRRRINPKYLREATQQALEVLKSGQAERKLREYVAVTQKYAGKKTI